MNSTFVAPLQWRVERYLPAAVIACGLVLWEIGTHVGWISSLFFPPPSEIVLTLFRLCGSGDFWLSLGMTLYRVGLGLLFGAGAGLLTGWLMGASRSARVAVDPLLAALHPMPKVAMLPIFLILLGLGESAKIAPVALAAFFPMTINTLAGVRQIDHAYWEVATSYGASGFELLRRVIFPGSLPMVLTGLRLAANDALVVAIAIEMLSADRGLGAHIWMTWQTLRTEELYATLLVIGALGLTGNKFLRGLIHRLLPWHKEYSSK